jgi:hypothetical protein
MGLGLVTSNSQLTSKQVGGLPAARQPDPEQQDRPWVSRLRYLGGEARLRGHLLVPHPRCVFPRPLDSGGPLPLPAAHPPVQNSQATSSRFLRAATMCSGGPARGERSRAARAALTSGGARCFRRPLESRGQRAAAGAVAASRVWATGMRVHGGPQPGSSRPGPLAPYL